MKFNSAVISEIVIFVPTTDDNMFLQWYKADPSEGAKGSVISFKALKCFETDDIAVVYNGDIRKANGDESNWPQKIALDTMIPAIIEHLGLDQNKAELCVSFIDALLSDEADDLDNSSFEYRWVDMFNDYIPFNVSIGTPTDRIQIRVKSSQFSSNVAVEISGNEFISEAVEMQMSFGISNFSAK